MLRCELSPATIKRSMALLLKPGLATLPTIKSLSIFAAIICSSLSPR